MSNSWMQNVNVRFGIYVAIAAMPVIIGDMSAGHFGTLTLVVMFANMLNTAKAFMSDPTQVSTSGGSVISSTTVSTESHASPVATAHSASTTLPPNQGVSQ